MSRHRDVRSMNYSEEYDGYDDVYGHSMEDDHCVSPSVEQFLFDRSKQQNIASFITEPDIKEDNEDVDEPSSSSNDEKYNLSELERAKLVSCLETIRNVIGDTVSDSKLKEKIILSNFDTNTALDTILKESSPKKDIDFATSKKRLEPHPDVSIDNSNTSMFKIPRFSFKKEHNLSKDSTSTMQQLYNRDRSKDVNQSLKTFSPLAGFISQNTESINSDTAKISLQSNTNVQSFSTLAALTADYLQNSNVANNIESWEKHESPIAQFVIPKLLINEKGSEETKSVPSPKFYDNENARRQVKFTNISSKHKIDLLQNDFSNMNIFPSIVRDVESDGLKIPVNIVNEICTQSSDDWVDLSSALKEAEFLSDNAFCNDNVTTSRKLYRNTHNVEIYLEDDNRVTPNVLPVTLNLCALRYVKLPYTKKNVSVFGKTLCKQWRIKRPVLRANVQHYKTIKPFDFSIPYQNSNRS